MKKTILAALMASAALSGCMAIPLIGIANGMDKGGTHTVTLEGRSSNQAAIDSFKKAVRTEGGFVTSSNSDATTATFKDVAIDLQMSVEPAEQRGSVRVIIQSSSAGNVARAYEFKDNVGDLPLKVAADMTGFSVVDKKRTH